MRSALRQRLGCALLGLALLGGQASAEDAAEASAAADFSRAAGAQKAGRFEDAAAGFADAARRYATAGNRPLEAEALLHAGEAQHALGAHLEALATLDEALERAETAGDLRRSAAIRLARGSVHASLGANSEAEHELSQARDLAHEAGAAQLEAAALGNLANVHAASGSLDEALLASRHAAELASAAGDAELEAQALANTARLALEAGDTALAERSALAAGARGEALPDSHTKSFTLISAARSLALAAQRAPAARDELRVGAHGLLGAALASAEAIGDPRAASWALGELGALYESDGRRAEAQGLTRRAAFAAQQAGADEALWRWEAQSGRLLDALGQREEAIAAYRRAIAAIQRIRPQLMQSFAAGGTSFRDSIGPVYLGLADLLLRSSEGSSQDVAQAPLLEARSVMELLKADELRDYFHDDCVDAFRARVAGVEQVSSSAAVVYHVLLPDRIEALVGLPSGQMKRVVTPVAAAEVTREIRALRELLVKRTTRQYLPHAQTLYRWLIAPLEPVLGDASVLVFVPDGPLRTIPFGALHDGERFLIEKKALATTPGIALTDPRPLTGALSPLLVGLSESREGLPPLPFVPGELRAIQSRHGGALLLDEGFRVSDLRRVLSEQPISVLHVASHAEFTAAGEGAWLLAWDGRLSMDQLRDDVGLYRYRKQPLELLTLSACETAAGDDRAALGLSGVAVKAGARSALGTLWQVSDEAASLLVVDFYDQLGRGMSRAEALRHAQQGLLEDLRFDHPGYWAPFLLIGNWL